MAKRIANHVDFHLSETWDYITGSGYTNPAHYKILTDGLLHDVFHVLYYPAIYLGGPIAILGIICVVVALIEEGGKA